MEIQINEDNLTACCPLTSALPIELLFSIFIFVGERDLENVAATCRVMKTLINYNEIWRELYKLSFPRIALPITTNWRSELLWARGAARRKERYSFNQMYGLCGRIPQKPISFKKAPSYFEDSKDF